MSLRLVSKLPSQKAGLIPSTLAGIAGFIDRTRGTRTMAIDTHIKFDGVDGESTHKEHKGEIELLSWDWGVSNAECRLGAAARARARPTRVA